MKKKIIVALFLFAAGFMVTAAVLLMSGPKMRYQPTLKTYESLRNLPPEGAIPFDLPHEDSADLNIPAQTQQNMKQGKVYYQNYCVFCHGDNGKGDGPVGLGYVPKPADLTNDSIKAFEDSKLFKVSFTGTGHSPVLERIVPPKYRKYIILYIKNSLKTD